MTGKKLEFKLKQEPELRTELELLANYEIVFEPGICLQGVYKIKSRKVKNRTKKWYKLIGDFEDSRDQDKIMMKACAAIVKYAFENKKEDISEDHFGLVKDKDLLWEGKLEDAISMFDVSSLEEAYEHVKEKYKDVFTKKKDIRKRRWERFLKWFEIYPEGD